MKLEFRRQFKIIAGIGGLALIFPTLNEPAKSEGLTDGSGAAVASVFEQTNAVPAQAEDPVIQKAPPAGPPPDLKISPALAEVIKLVQAGVNEDVLLAYVTNSPDAFVLTAEEILYLNDLGTSPKVLAVMVRSGNNQTSVAPALTSPPPASPPPAVVETIPAATSMATTTEPAPSTIISYVTSPPSPSSSPPSVNYFYDSLSPYGSWVEVADYGWCWQPTVAVVNTSWRPYCDRGRWVYSDCGWYWMSDYSWGWAPFHYGRWYCPSSVGWVWVPDNTWGPAWVSWRVAGDYCGWAPLPPAACYRAGFGFTYYNAHVGVGFDFGLSCYNYNFIPVHRFCDYNPSRYVASAAYAQTVYNNSTVINNYVVGNNNTVVNRGIDPRHVSSATGTEVRRVQIRDHSPSVVRTTRQETLEKHGSQLVVYRPQLPTQPPSAPNYAARNAALSARTERGASGHSTTLALARNAVHQTGPEPLSRTAQTEHSLRSSRTQITGSMPGQIDAGSGKNVAPPQESNRQANANEPARSQPQIRQSSVTPVPQTRSTGNSQPVVRTTPGSTPSSRPLDSMPAIRPPGSTPLQSPGIARSQPIRSETSATPKLIPNYSRPQTTPAPTIHVPARAPTPSISQPVARPSAQPQYRSAQPAMPSYAAPQMSRPAPVHSPSVSSAPARQSAVPAQASAPARTQASPASNPVSR